MEKKDLAPIPANFSPSLFWDVDPSRLDLNVHAGFIVERVVTRGNMADWRMLLIIYDKKRIRQEAMAIRSLDPKSLNFLGIYFNIEPAKFRCCT